MKAEVCFTFIITLLLDSVLLDTAGECDLVGFYQELGCTAVPDADNSTQCPEAFTCPDLHPDPTMCYYRGIKYADRAPLPQRLIKNQCSQACSCRVYGEPRFECAAVDCVELFDSEPPQQCVAKYELDSCCSIGNVCGKDAVAALKTCQVDGKVYREGQIFEPKNTRKTCICTESWNGAIDDMKYCKDIDCGIEIHFQEEIMNNCAPIFGGGLKSCPFGFQCPTNTTKVVRGLNVRSVSAQCVFGNSTLSVGDEVVVDEKCTKCTCEVPPFVSCTKQYACAK